MFTKRLLLYFLFILIIEFHTNDILKVKRSELRLYCDLLMQQVHSVKDAAMTQPAPDIEVIIRMTKNEYLFSPLFLSIEN